MIYADVSNDRPGFVVIDEKTDKPAGPYFGDYEANHVNYFKRNVFGSKNVWNRVEARTLERVFYTFFDFIFQTQIFFIFIIIIIIVRLILH